jgi:hypothetical protein
VPDRYVVKLATAIASNTGGPYTATWDRAVVTSAGTLRTAWAVSPSIASNAHTSRVDIYRQTDAPSVGSNTATTILVDPIVLINNRDAVQGTIRASNDRVAVGDTLELRTYSGNLGSQPAFLNLTASVEIERD